MTNTRYSNDSKRKTYYRNVILIEICEEKNIVDSRKETDFEMVIRVNQQNEALDPFTWYSYFLRNPWPGKALSEISTILMLKFYNRRGQIFIAW